MKVMSVPDSRCIRVVDPDDHVNIGFHEVLLYDMGEEELPFVALSELDCLRKDWPKPLFIFMSRYQHDLRRMRRECMNDSAAHSRVTVPIVVNTYRHIWASTLPCFILSWHSYGDVWLRGSQCRKERLKIVWIIYDGLMKSRRL